MKGTQAANADRSIRRNRNVFLLLFLVFYMTDAAGGYLMIYLRGIGFSTLQMGLLTSAASLLALGIQPFLGDLADRAASRNQVLMLALGAAALLMPLLRLSTAFLYILLIYTLFVAARNVLHPLTDTITLEYSQTTLLPA